MTTSPLPGREAAAEVGSGGPPLALGAPRATLYIMGLAADAAGGSRPPAPGGERVESHRVEG